MIQHTKGFFSLFVRCDRKYCTNKTVTIYTTICAHAWHFILHFYIQQHYHGSLGLFKNRFHEFAFFPFFVRSESIQSKHKYQIHVAAYTYKMLSFQQKNRMFLLFARYLKIFIEPLLHQSNIPTISHNHYISLHKNDLVAY